MLTGLSLGPGGLERFWDLYFGHIPLDHAIIFDPFVGGGTSIIEASRCNARVIGYDIDPVASSITRFELESPTWGRLPESVSRVTKGISAHVMPHHRTTLPGGEHADVLHHFWVEVTTCQKCGDRFEVHPHHLLAYDKAKRLQWTFCRVCHQVAEQLFGRKWLTCTCGTRTTVHAGTLQKGRLICPSCRSVDELSARGRVANIPPVWNLFAQEYVEPGSNCRVRRFKRATESDQAMYVAAANRLAELEARDGVFAPERAIPKDGRSDSRPLIHGFRRYRELFNDRQLLHLTLLGKAIASVPDAKERRLLGLAFSEHLTTNCMYAGYAFGYRRLCPLFSIHSYRHITRPVELNPWMDRVGRGTFPNALGKIRRAILFAKRPSDLDPQGGRRPASRPVGPLDGPVGDHPKALIGRHVRAAIRTHTSTDLSAFPDESVDLVLTDPPYFDNISYSELSDFYLAWHQALGIAESPYDDPRRSAPMRANLAVTAKTDKAIDEYQSKLAAILRECCRALKPDGICAFTYHHKSAKAWRSLGEALARSGLRASSVIPLRGEGQGGLHSYEGTIKWDAVFVCRKSALGPGDGAVRIIVRKQEPRRAAEATRAYTARLSKNKKIGFRPPDQLNLYRALLIAAARVGPLTPRTITLEAALELPFEG
jgi:adenine-specific DNA methylase